jgi:hypothetical protein
LLSGNHTENTITLLKKYLEDGANPNIPGICGNGNYLVSPLYVACHGNTEYTKEIIKILLDNGAHINPFYTCNTILTPIETIVKNNKSLHSIDIIKLLLQNEANISGMFINLLKDHPFANEINLIITEYLEKNKNNKKENKNNKQENKNNKQENNKNNIFITI